MCGTAETSAAVHVARDADCAIYILFCDGIISTVVITQERGGTTYISYVDSSGYSRGFSTDFIVAVVRSVSGLVVCFSYPKEEPVLAGSARNPGKNVMGPQQLFSYWCRVFDRRCCGGCYRSTWSNFRPGRSHPYGNLDEIEMFDDDPKSKMISNFRKAGVHSIRDVFEGLLARADFLKGGLLFSRCDCGRTGAPDGTNAGILESEVRAQSRPGDPPAGIPQMVSMLQSSDFSDRERALGSTRVFVEEFAMRLRYFRMGRSPAGGRNGGEAAARIIPRVVR